MRTRQRETGAVVVEGGIQPRRRVVALAARLREIRRDVVRIRCPLVVLQVTGHARVRGQVVVVIDMAVGALPRRHRVHTGQGEGGKRVIERRVRPGDRVMTLIAGLREASRNVVRIGSRLIVLQMAAHAGGS